MCVQISEKGAIITIIIKLERKTQYPEKERERGKQVATPFVPSFFARRIHNDFLSSRDEGEVIVMTTRILLGQIKEEENEKEEEEEEEEAAYRKRGAAHVSSAPSPTICCLKLDLPLSPMRSQHSAPPAQPSPSEKPPPDS